MHGGKGDPLSKPRFTCDGNLMLLMIAMTTTTAAAAAANRRHFVGTHVGVALVPAGPRPASFLSEHCLLFYKEKSSRSSIVMT